MNRYAYVILFLFFFTPSLSAQTPTVTISTGKSCAGQEVLLSITASNLSNIASITLYVDVDTTRLTFVSLENIDPQLEELYFRCKRKNQNWQDFTKINRFTNSSAQNCRKMHIRWIADRVFPLFQPYRWIATC
jgi:hypothetical protein